MGTRVVKSGTLLALLVLAAFLALIPSSAYASANRDNALECASNLLGAMISYDSYPSMYSVGALDEDDLWLENALPIYDEESQANGSQELFLWPIMEGNRVVATMLEVPDGAAEPVFRLSSDYIDAVEEVLASDGLRVLRKSGVSEIVSADCPDGSAMSARAMLTDAFNKESGRIVVGDVLDSGFVPSREMPVASSGMARAPYAPQLGMKRVKQTYDMLCWAACVSSISQYMTGSSSLDFAISNALYGSLNHAGTLDSIVDGFGLHKYSDGSTAIKAETYSSYLSDSELKRWINNGVPFVAEFGNYFNAVHHAVVVGGYAVSSNGAMSIVVMDPWTGSYANYGKTSAGTYIDGEGTTWLHGTVVLTEWQKPFGGSKWSWVNFNGSLETGWMQKYGNWYWFDSDGYLAESQWRKIDGKWYYFNPGGSMETGWYYDGAYWFYLGSDGAARIGWHSIDGYWYSFDDDGGMRRGWYKDGNTWYYLRTEWDTPSGGPAGSMLCSGSWTIDGKTYQFDSSGVCLNP